MADRGIVLLYLLHGVLVIVVVTVVVIVIVIIVIVIVSVIDIDIVIVVVIVIVIVGLILRSFDDTLRCTWNHLGFIWGSYCYYHCYCYWVGEALMLGCTVLVFCRLAL